MEVFKGFNNYDVGYFVYDLWTLIIISVLCVFLVFLVNRSLFKIWPLSVPGKPKMLDYFFPVLMVIGQVSTSSDITRLVLLAIMIVVFFILKKKLHAFVALALCSLVGFGFNFLPLGIAIVIFIVGSIKNRKKQIT